MASNIYTNCPYTSRHTKKQKNKRTANGTKRHHARIRGFVGGVNDGELGTRARAAPFTPAAFGSLEAVQVRGFDERAGSFRFTHPSRRFRHSFFSILF